MIVTPSTDEILRDIEFELAQSSIGSDDLAAALESVRRFQAAARERAVSASVSRPSADGAAVSLFQINEMLLSLFGETIAAQQTLRLDLRRALRLPDFPVLRMLLPPSTATLWRRR
jgi:hypothetical protein